MADDPITLNDLNIRPNELYASEPQKNEGHVSRKNSPTNTCSKRIFNSNELENQSTSNNLETITPYYYDPKEPVSPTMSSLNILAMKNIPKIKKIVLTKFEISLNNWIDDGRPNGGNRLNASQKLKELDAFKFTGSFLEIDNYNVKDLPNTFDQARWSNKLQSFSLVHNRLTTLPSSFSSFINLKKIMLGNNNLGEVPAAIRNITGLKILCLNDNIITELPEWIGQLVNLEELNLNKNKLVRLTDSIRTLAMLRTLSLDKNKLVELPSEMEQMTNLRKLSLVENKHLNILPLTLGNCANLIEIEIFGTQIAKGVRNGILSSCRAVRDEEGHLSLAARLKNWMRFSGKQYNFSPLTDRENFTQFEQANINEWLLRLESTRDFGNALSDLAKCVCKILHTLSHTQPAPVNPFRQNFFANLSDNLAACGDRAAMLLNLIFIDWRLYKVSTTNSYENKMEILAGVARTLTLRDSIQKRLNHMQAVGESVEVFLYFESKLKERLKLETAIDTMIYETIGNRKSIKSSELVTEVELNYLTTLIQIPALDRLLIAHPEYGEEYQKKKDVIEDDMQSKMDALFDNERISTQDIEYIEAVNALKSTRETELTKLRYDYVQKILPHLPMIET